MVDRGKLTFAGLPVSVPRGRALVGRRSRRPAGRLIPLRELRPQDVAAWGDLALRAVEPNPFFEPEFVLPAARHLGGSDVGLLVVEGLDREWLACMPVIPRLKRGRITLPAITAWRAPPYGCLGTPLVAEPTVELATERLIEHALHISRVGIVALPWLGDEGPVAAAVRGRPATRHAPFERPVWRRGSRADLEGTLSPHHRREIRRLARRLEEQLGAPLQVRDGAERAGSVEDFVTVEASGWKGQRGTALNANEAHARFFREMCAAFRASGRLQLLELGTGSRVASSKCNLLAGDCVFHFKIAFDEALRPFRPGLQLEVRMIELFQQRMDQRWMDSCAPAGNKAFEQLWPDRQPIASYVLAASRTVSWLITHRPTVPSARSRDARATGRHD